MVFFLFKQDWGVIRVRATRNGIDNMQLLVLRYQSRCVLTTGFAKPLRGGMHEK